MIYNWDIITHLDNSNGDQLFTLVIDGSERDAQAIAKKLSGYVKEPVKAEEPFAFAFPLPPNLDEEMLAKIRVAVREAIDQIHKVNQYVPGGALGAPLFTTREPLDPFFDLSQATFTATGTFFQGIENTSSGPLTNSVSKKQEQPPSEVKNSSEGLSISDKDMLIKDMEDTLLGKMPEGDILSEKTKFEVYKHMKDEDTSATSKQREQKLDTLAAPGPSLEDTIQDFEKKLKDPDSDVDLEDLQTVTSKITEKDLGFIKHAQTNPNLPSVSQKEPVQDPESDVELPAETKLGNTIIPKGTPGDLPEITVRAQNPDALEKTFNLETTISPEIIRTQYEKSIRNTIRKSADEKDALEVPVSAKTVLVSGKISNNSDSQALANQSGKSHMEEQAPGKTFFRIRRKQQKQPAAPQAPQAPKAPTIPPPAAAPAPRTPAPGTPAPVNTPTAEAPAAVNTPSAQPPAQAQNPAAGKSSVKQTISAESAETTKTIDHSIELPLSELRKHNWPLEVPLLPTYTLANLVLSGNRLAHATAISVMENPGKMYNPLVFHGTTGTGKTHFLNALAYGFSEKFGQENVFMTNGVRFSRGIQRYVMEGNIEKFEKFMQSVKVLLIDDIHLLAINEQNRAYISKLLHSFLKEQKQIVITSKYPPESLEKLEELIKFRLDSGWISELKPASGATHFRIVKTMLLNNGVDLSDAQISQFFGGSHITLSTIVRNIRRLKVLENLVFPHLPENERSQANMFEKLLATTGEDPTSELLSRDPEAITSIHTSGFNDWGRVGFFYPSHRSSAMNWMVYAVEQRAKELGISGGFEIAVRSSYSTENIISSAFKIANLCDNKKLRGAIILGPDLKTCEPSIRENFYDILTHMLEIMLIRCGIINDEALRLPSTYVKVISELLR